MYRGEAAAFPAHFGQEGEVRHLDARPAAVPDLPDAYLVRTSTAPSRHQNATHLSPCLATATVGVTIRRGGKYVPELASGRAILKSGGSCRRGSTLSSGLW
jgi:hypothetical protein